MRILFLCGCLEHGKDGVGDYSMILASELLKLNNDVALVGLNDFFVSEIADSVTDNGLQIRRLPQSLAMDVKLLKVKELMATFKPDWISLQFVPYSFHPRGIPVHWIGFLKALSGNHKFHIMFHELSIGDKKDDPLKEKIIGWFQRQVIKRLVKTMRPDAVMTSLDYYRDILLHMGVTSTVIPVFSNIHIGTAVSDGLYNKIKNQFDNLSTEYVTAVFFGSIHPVAGIIENLLLFNTKVIAEGKRLLLVHVGRSGNVKDFFASVKLSVDCECLVLGEGRDEEIAFLFKNSDCGLSTYSYEFVGKSGSIAAMLNNGLPVALLRDNFSNYKKSIPYIKMVKEIVSVDGFCRQPDTFSSIYGITNAAAVYNKTFTNSIKKDADKLANYDINMNNNG